MPAGGGTFSLCSAVSTRPHTARARTRRGPRRQKQKEPTTEVILAFSADSREDVDRIADLALAHGGSASNEPADLGFMCQRSFQDPDGHLWEVFWMDPAQIPQ